MRLKFKTDIFLANLDSKTDLSWKDIEHMISKEEETLAERKETKRDKSGIALRSLGGVNMNRLKRSSDAEPLVPVTSDFFPKIHEK